MTPGVKFAITKLKEMQNSASVYYEVLQGDKLHWTIQHALHNKTIKSIVASVQEKLEKIISEGEIISRLDADMGTLAAILIKGIICCREKLIIDGMMKRNLI